MAKAPGGTERKRVTIRDVAALAGVDASLVSRVLNDHPKASAGPSTRERILEAARELGYQPNVAARGLRTAKTWTLGLLLPNLTNPMYATIARAAGTGAGARLWAGLRNPCRGRGRATFARMMQQGRVDGLLPRAASLATRSCADLPPAPWPGGDAQPPRPRGALVRDRRRHSRRGSGGRPSGRARPYRGSRHFRDLAPSTPPSAGGLDFMEAGTALEYTPP